MLFSTSQRLGLSCGVAVMVMLMDKGKVHGALIQSTTPADVHTFDTASVFDASHTGNAYTLEPGTSLAPQGFDIRDLFGGSYGTYGYEHNDVIFNNGQPAGTVSAVNVTLAAPVSLTSFHLDLEDDGSGGNRSASQFRLFAGGQLIDDVPILDTYGDQSYTTLYGSNYIDISDTFSGLPSVSDFTLELIQNQSGGGGSGVRALEFEGTGVTSGVPEPTSVASVLIGGWALCGRRRRA